MLSMGELSHVIRNCIHIIRNFSRIDDFRRQIKKSTYANRWEAVLIGMVYIRPLR